jgi:lipopolysaccharide/colanic/teichoic acid biosynthesis glycosyltransferase
MDPPKTNKFKVYIPQTPKWKIEAIARFKSMQNRKRKNVSCNGTAPEVVAISEVIKKQKMDEIMKGCYVSL